MALRSEYQQYGTLPRFTLWLLGSGGGAGKSSVVEILATMGVLPGTSSSKKNCLNHDDLIARHPLFDRLRSSARFAAADLLHSAVEAFGRFFYRRSKPCVDDG